jgi:hypothetical protein
MLRRYVYYMKLWRHSNIYIHTSNYYIRSSVQLTRSLWLYYVHVYVRTYRRLNMKVSSFFCIMRVFQLFSSVFVFLTRGTYIYIHVCMYVVLLICFYADNVLRHIDLLMLCDIRIFLHRIHLNTKYTYDRYASNIAIRA